MTDKDTHIKSDWTEVVRRKAQAAAKQPPAGSWDAIAARMAQKPAAPAAPKKAKVVRRPMRWLWTAAAAAAVALIVTVGIKVTQQAGQVAPLSPTAQAPAAAGQQLVAQAAAEETMADVTKAGKKHHRRHRRYKRRAAAIDEIIEDSVNIGALYASANGGPGVANRPMGQGEDDEAPSSSLNPWQNYSDREYNAYRQMEDNARTLGASGSLPDALRSRRHPWAVGVNVSGLSVADRNQTLSSTDGGVTYSYKHSMPVAVGVDVSRDFVHGALTATVGLTYTWLKSQVTDPAGTTTSRTMGTLSLPVGVRWNALRNGRFRAYVGAEAAPGVVTSTPESIESPGKVYLLNASGILGAQYFVSQRVSIYAEPRVVFHTADLPMPTIWGVSDVDFNLQLGVKWHF